MKNNRTITTIRKSEHNYKPKRPILPLLKKYVYFSNITKHKVYKNNGNKKLLPTKSYEKQKNLVLFIKNKKVSRVVFFFYLSENWIKCHTKKLNKCNLTKNEGFLFYFIRSSCHRDLRHSYKLFLGVVLLLATWNLKIWMFACSRKRRYRKQKVLNWDERAS